MATRSGIVNILLQLGMQGDGQVKQGLDEVRRNAEQINTAMSVMGSIARRIGLVAVAALSAREMRNAVRAGIEWNDTLQQTRDSMTAMIVASDPILRGDMERAFSAAGVHMRTLQEEADRTGVSLESLFGLFADTAPMAAAAGISLGQYAELTADAAQASNALGIETGRVSRELQAILAGRVSQRGILSQVLRLTTEEVQLATEQGRLYELLSERLGRYLVDVQGLGAENNRLRNTWRQLLGTLTEPLFEDLEASVKALQQSLSREEVQEEIRVVAELLRDLFEALRTGAGFLAENRRTIGLILGAYALWRVSVIAATMATIGYTRAIQAATVATRVNAAAVSAHPIGILATAIAVGAGAWISYRRRIAEANAEMRAARGEAREFADTMDTIASEADRRRVLGPLEEEFAVIDLEFRLKVGTLDAIRRELRTLDFERRDPQLVETGRAESRRITEINRRRDELLREERRVMEGFEEMSRERETLQTRITALTSEETDERIRQADIDRERNTLIDELESKHEQVIERIAEIERARMTEVQLLTDIDRRAAEIREKEESRLAVLERVENEEERTRAIKQVHAETTLALTELEEERETVLERIRTRIEEGAAARERELRVIRQIEDAEAALAASQAQAARAAVEGDPFAFADARRDDLTRAIEMENAAIDRQIELLRERAMELAESDDPQDQVRRLQMEERLVGLEQQRVQNAQQLARMQHEILTGLIDWMNQFGTLAEQVAGVMTGSLDAAVRGLADGIEGLINGTMTWREAWDQLVLTVIRAMVRLVAEFIAQQLVLFAMRQIMGAANVAAVQAEAGAATVAWAPAAVSASTATLGGAAAAGLAAYQASLVAGTASAMAASASPGFDEGGFTGGGDPKAVAGLVHKKEFVFSAPATATLGIGFLDTLHEAAKSGRGFAEGGFTGGGRPAGSGVGPQNINIAEIRTRNEMREFMEQDGVRLVVDELERRGNRVAR